MPWETSEIVRGNLEQQHGEVGWGRGHYVHPICLGGGKSVILYQARFIVAIVY